MALIRQPSICARCMRSLVRQQKPTYTNRAFSSTASQSLEGDGSATLSQEDTPRWKQTPPRMKMPFRVRPLPKQAEWRVNDQQEPLDQMYDRFLGNKTRGRDSLPEEIKWLAVTHKSFDHARRGFNDRLAFLGKRIVDLQTSLALLDAPAPKAPPLEAQTSERSGLPSETGNGEGDVFRHPALEGAENVTAAAKEHILSRARLAGVATSYGLERVVRWKPRRTEALAASGQETVLAHTIYSIIGALALHHGGEMAATVTRDRVLRPLGLR